MVLGIDEAVVSGSAAVSLLPSAEQIRAWTAALADGAATGDVSDGERVDSLRALEELKCAAAGAQAALAVQFEASQRRAQATAGIRAERQTRGIALQVGLARRESHHRAKRLLAFAGILHSDMLHVLAALRAGKISEWRAQLIVNEARHLSSENRRMLDVCLAEDQDWLEAQGDKQLVAEARRLAYRFDPHTFVERARRAERERRVTTRTAPDTMCYMTALLPVVQAVAVYAALKKHADSVVAQGDSRTRDQIMADSLVERVTGQATADAVPIEVGIVMSDRTATGMDDEPATVRGYGPIPADLARFLIRMAKTHGLATLRRLYADPTTGQMTARESRAGDFPDGLADLMELRDGDLCRTPWCDAPIRDDDHVKARAERGKTTLDNGQGLCEACNIAKEAPGWKARPRPGPDGHAVDTTTPTGHTYTSVAPRVRVVHRPPIVLDYYVPDLHAS
jgi:Domain of unknown function (DUF222)/HNH endonuclease